MPQGAVVSERVSSALDGSAGADGGGRGGGFPGGWPGGNGGSSGGGRSTTKIQAEKDEGAYVSMPTAGHYRSEQNTTHM